MNFDNDEDLMKAIMGGGTGGGNVDDELAALEAEVGGGKGKGEDDLAKSEIIELNELTTKENDYLIIGCYGNGSAFLKASFFKEIRDQKQSFKIKFINKEKNINKKKTLFAELYQITSNGKNLLILLTKIGIKIENENYLLNYFKEKNITYKEIICFDSLTTNNFYSENKIDKCYYIKKCC